MFRDPTIARLADSQEDTKKYTCRLNAYQYDFMLRRAGGRLLAVVDWMINKTLFSVDEWGLEIVRIEGDVVSKEVTTLSAEGLPYPEGDGSPYVLKLVVSAGGTAYIRVPVKARAFSVFVAYITLRSAGMDVEARFFVTLGGNIIATRNRPPKRLVIPADTWIRMSTHWFMELHHGCSEVDLEIYNPNASDVAVYIGIIVAGEIVESVKAHGLLIGWETQGAYIPLSAETFDWTVDVMLPLSYADCVHMSVFIDVESTDGTSVNVDIYLNGVLISSGSTTGSAVIGTSFKYLLKRSGVYGYPTLSIRMVVSTSGSAKVKGVNIIFYGFSDEFTYMKGVSGTIGAGTTVTIADYSSDIRHIAGGKLIVTAASDADAIISAGTPEGEIEIWRVPAGTSETVDIQGRYIYIKINNPSGSASASYRGTLLLSDAFMPR